ncbi:hypothetical protein EVAR_16361_1 [Eumeta japonica]|uniref:Uncharacterized protein n=1 Tax=Eumeta variegata TaxID=151549 RepID=A0A4C1VWQ3_EUMVA|nr:hypothetical protein EVAR_16361_1 [Eumeta japonica]
MDITVWMSSPNDVVPAVAEAGATHGWLAADSFSRRSRAALGGSVGFGLPRVGAGERRQPGVGLFPARSGKLIISRSYGPTFRPIGIRPIMRNKFRAFGHPYSWPYAAGDNSRRRFLS